jgi:predicted restriction endonuclease
MNWVKANRENLTLRNYVLKANTQSGYWFGIWKKKLEGYQSLFKSDFNIILFGSENDETDFYTIPFSAIKDLLKLENLYSFQGSQRWVGDIRNHILKFRHSTIERNISEFFSVPQLGIERPSLQKESLHDYAIENAKREVQIRIKQSVFRKKVLDNFGNKCCLTGVTESELLVASHIIPWAAKLNTRLSPHNGLCLSVLYDNLFDKGFFTLSDEGKVIVTSKMGSVSLQLRKWLNEIAGKSISAPEKYEISRESLSYHRNTIFDGF